MNKVKFLYFTVNLNNVDSNNCNREIIPQDKSTYNLKFVIYFTKKVVVKRNEESESEFEMLNSFMDESKAKELILNMSNKSLTEKT